MAQRGARPSEGRDSGDARRDHMCHWCPSSVTGVPSPTSPASTRSGSDVARRGEQHKPPIHGDGCPSGGGNSEWHRPGGRTNCPQPRCTAAGRRGLGQRRPVSPFFACPLLAPPPVPILPSAVPRTVRQWSNARDPPRRTALPQPLRLPPWRRRGHHLPWWQANPAPITPATEPQPHRHAAHSHPSTPPPTAALSHDGPVAAAERSWPPPLSAHPTTQPVPLERGRAPARGAPSPHRGRSPPPPPPPPQFRARTAAPPAAPPPWRAGLVWRWVGGSGGRGGAWRLSRRRRATHGGRPASPRTAGRGCRPPWCGGQPLSPPARHR